ncbi:MAG: glycoside hydrolase family 88 protein [Bacteroidales bacterium]|nr:glycoside hydrolase family 88 protein [Bacteroidales bacterium]
MISKYLYYFIATLVLTASCNNIQQPLPELIDEQLTMASEQYKEMHAAVPADLMPRSTDPETGELITSGTGWWCSGFFPGSLWYLYEYTGDDELKQMAMERTALIEKEQYNTGTHDLGFMINDSYGQGLRIAGIQSYRPVLVNGAYSLLTRFNEVVGCIRSWDHGDWEFPVIVDNMMNLEYLMWAFRETGDSSFYDVSVSHTEKTMENHYRDDFSSYHLVDYDTISGEVITRQTVQGFADESAWARGQSWGFYGFVTMYRDTKDERYLEQAVNIADFLLSHPNMPDDGVPYWDFNAPDIPDARRDASAGAILASGLIELSRYVDAADSEKYLAFAEKIIRTLSSEKYRAQPGENGNFLLKHSVGHLPNNSEVDVPLTYADYFFIESLMRLIKLNS